MANRANCIFQDDLNKISHPKCSPENMTLKGHASDVSRFVTKEELMLCDFWSKVIRGDRGCLFFEPSDGYEEAERGHVGAIGRSGPRRQPESISPCISEQAFRFAMSSIVTIRHIWLFKFKLKLFKNICNMVLVTISSHMQLEVTVLDHVDRG